MASSKNFDSTSPVKWEDHNSYLSKYLLFSVILTGFPFSSLSIKYSGIISGTKLIGITPDFMHSSGNVPKLAILSIQTAAKLPCNLLQNLPYALFVVVCFL